MVLICGFKKAQATAHLTKVFVIAVILFAIAYLGSPFADSVKSVAGNLGYMLAWIAIFSVFVGLVYVVLRKVTR